MSQKIYDLAIIGGGPAASAASVYAGRKKLNTIQIVKEWGGQSVVSTDIHNWIGTKSISGNDLANSFKEHIEEYKSDTLEIKNTEAKKVIEENNLFKIILSNEEEVFSRTILIATGSNRRKLEVKGAQEFEYKGVTYCASCDGLFFAGQSVCVVGSGNSSFESALQLLAYCKDVTILIRGENLKADALTVEAIKKHPNAKILLNTEIKEIIGDKKVEKIIIKNNKTNNEEELNITGVFVEIGQIPNTDIVKGLVDLDEMGKVIIDPWTNKTNKKGIWSAGDCTNIKYHQNNIAAGEGVKALEDIYQYIKSNF